MFKAMREWRKKYTLAQEVFLVGSALAYVQDWPPEMFIALGTLVLGIFGAADLADKGKFKNVPAEKVQS